MCHIVLGIKNPFKGKNLYLNVYISQANDKPCVTISAPYYDNEGNINGVLAADLFLVS